MQDETELRRIRQGAKAMFAGDRIDLPAGWQPLWRAFLELHSTRGEGFAGPVPISFAEIEAYVRLMRLPLEPRHIAVIRAIDNAWMDHISAARGRQGALPALTPEVFMAVFG
ncbi:MAG: hypothetical protein J0H54_01430 [Rhizobiales bacterium]|nr:hypothetical protein [Hyphomicrobiales bacterium]